MQEENCYVARAITYHIPLGRGCDNDDDDNKKSNVILRLSPLPPIDGVWSPVGAHAWYASAVLASLLLLWNPDHHHHDIYITRDVQTHPFDTLLASRTVSNSVDDHGGKQKTTIVELGSGAVGLSGFVCVLALQYWLKQWGRDNHAARERWRVLLTDNDGAVLDQLQRNLHNNQSTIMPSGAMVDVEVDAWDWNNEHPVSSQLSPDEVLLVIGSELVYTQETAEACVQLLLRLLNKHPAVEIWIVQVTDRFGWWEIVVPTLSKNHVCVTSIPILPEHHELACTMVPMGGTLDRHAYGAFCIHNQKSTST